MNGRLGEVVEALVDAGFEEAEVYAKRGRTRRIEITSHTRGTGFHDERGWAVRASGPRASFFAAGTGEPSPEGPWPEPDGRPLRVPDPQPVPAWSEPSDFDAPLLGEPEGLRLLEGTARELDTEMPGARLLAAVLEDGSSTSEIVNQRGVSARWRSRVALLRLEAAAPGGGSGPSTVSLHLGEREARRFNPRAAARRLADRLVVRAAPPAERDRGELLLAPEVGQRLLAAVAPLFVGPRSASRLSRFQDRRGRIGSERLTLIDDGRLPGGLLEAPVDGEGLPTREVVLVEEGAFRQPLVAWWQVRGAEVRASGCSRRPSWRDLPVPGPTHLYLRPDPGVGVASLLGAVARGYYLVEATGPGHFEIEEDRFSLPVSGFALRQGRAVAPVGGMEMRGAISTFLHNLQAAARDLAFAPTPGGLIGCPTLLVTGLEVARAAKP